MDRLPNEILSKIIYQVLISSNFSSAAAWGAATPQIKFLRARLINLVSGHTLHAALRFNVFISVR